jgi:single-stranded-DNA-specific exonuclease
MLDRPPKWILKPQIEPPSWFLQEVQRHVPASSGRNAAKILWQRGIQDAETLAEFINPQGFKPSSPFEFGWEMQWAVERILHAAESGEKVAIWGDFDADGITSTSVLWDGLGQFFQQHTQLIYYIPDRLTESHGLNIPGIDRLGELDINLIVTCDTGSTNLAEINYANQLGIDVIVTDHHTLLDDRPPVVAMINPRSLPPDHAMADLSGVAVAYKLIEALYLTEPNIPQQPLEELLDLVAIGLIADLVALKGDCRYLAQVGLKHLETEFKQNPAQWRRPGIGRLLELCKKNGDRPTDISFGIGPRINAVSRIYGDASFCVELLTSRDRQHCEKLARETELANTRRQELQKNVLEQAKKNLEQIDLSTTSVIVLQDPQWPVGVLGLVAGQIAQEYGCPTILLTTDQGNVESVGSEGSVGSVGSEKSVENLARGSARSVNQIDLYQLVKSQEHLLDRFGGHPFAAGLSMPVENIPLFTEAINRELRQKTGEFGYLGGSTVEADLICVVAELGQDLFRELKLLEPCGMGNPSPQILIQNCWFEKVWHNNIRDASGRKIKYIKTEFKIKDDSSDSGFPGIWWGHYKEEIPQDKNNPETSAL